MLSGTTPNTHDTGASDARPLSTTPTDSGFSFSLDTYGKYSVTISLNQENKRVVAILSNEIPAVRSNDELVTQAIANKLTLRINDQHSNFELQKAGAALSSITPPDGQPTLKVEIALAGQPVGECMVDCATGTVIEHRQIRSLRTYDLRNIANQGDDYLTKWSESKTHEKYRPFVDLHTHFAGQIESSSLIELAIHHDTKYPASLLALAGITRSFLPHEIQKGAVSLRNLSESEVKRLTASMHIEPTEVSTFEHLEEIYKLRSPITKNVDLFPALLEEIALKYRADGVRYAELSLSNITDPQWLAKAHECLPRIEQETGVALRFLVGLSRHAPEEFNLDMADQVLFVARISPYVVGVDVMGHETNSTLHFRDVLTSSDPWDATKRLIDPRTQAPREDGLLEYRDKNPHFQIRIHAGENPVHPENVREAIAAGATRVGHGLYGMDETTLRESVARGVRVEFNPNSNLALNNINGHSPDTELPILRYLASGVKVTFGTDGRIYCAGGKNESYVAALAGASVADFLKVAKDDVQYTQTMRKAFVSHWNELVSRCISVAVAQHTIEHPELSSDQIDVFRRELESLSVFGSRGPLSKRVMTPVERDKWTEFETRILRAGNYGLPPFDHFPTSDFDWHKWTAESNARVANLNHQLTSSGITMHSFEDIQNLLQDRKPILISGASASSWPKIKDKEAVRTFLRTLVAESDPTKVIFVTGATHFGVEEELHQLVKLENARRQSEGLPTFTILGTVVAETKAEEVGPITDAVVCGDRWYAKSDKILPFIKRHDGEVVFIGGGNILNDEIQAAKNIGARFHLMKGPEGASTSKATIFEEAAFTTFDELKRSSAIY